MEQAVDAIFENGNFKVIDPFVLHLSEGQRVKLVVEESGLSFDEILALAAKVYEGLSESDIMEIEQIALDRKDFSENTNHDSASAFRYGHIVSRDESASDMLICIGEEC